jgi:hypothetical protein
MSTISKEFRHNPLTALVPLEGDFGDLATIASDLQSRLVEINNELSSTNHSDEKIHRQLSQEKDMLDIVIAWMGLP